MPMGQVGPKCQELPAPPHVLPAPGRRAMLNVEPCKEIFFSIQWYIICFDETAIEETMNLK